jgi:PPOX class probable F420-dependent enzyme
VAAHRIGAYAPPVDPADARARFASARLAHLATAGADGRPHVVAICFAVEGDTVFSAVDAKPKSTGRLRRLRNIAANPSVALLVDHYDDLDWDRLWWSRADGTASLLEPDTPRAAHARELLVARYPQYRRTPPEGTVIAVDVARWSGWAASG